MHQRGGWHHAGRQGAPSVLRDHQVLQRVPQVPAVLQPGLFVPARHGQRQRLLHERRDARQVREQTRAIVPRRDQDWRKRRQDEDPAGARERVDSGTTRCDRERPSRAEDTHPFRGYRRAEQYCGKRRGLVVGWEDCAGAAAARHAVGVSASGAARVRVVRRRGARAVVVPHPEQRRRPHLQRERRVPLLWHRRRERLGRVQRPAREHG